MNAYQHFSEAYDQLMADAPYEQWQQFFQEALQRYSIAPTQIADIGCGTGTLSLFFSDLGFDVYAIDPSPEMLMQAQQKYSLHRSEMNTACGNLVFIETDAANLELPERMDLAVSFCDSLSYIIEEDELAESFQAVYNALKPGGMFLFDMHTPYKITDVYGDSIFYESFETFTYIWETIADTANDLIDHYLTFFVKQEGGLFRKLEESHQQRGYDQETVKRLLRDAGFNRMEVFGDFTWEAPKETCERFFFIGFRE